MCLHHTSVKSFWEMQYFLHHCTPQHIGLGIEGVMSQTFTAAQMFGCTPHKINTNIWAVSEQIHITSFAKLN